MERVAKTNSVHSFCFTKKRIKPADLRNITKRHPIPGPCAMAAPVGQLAVDEYGALDCSALRVVFQGLGFQVGASDTFRLFC